MNFRSHSEDVIRSALLVGQEVYGLDTGTDGEDDVLIGDIESVKRDICHYLDVERMPDHWSLERIYQL